MPRDYTEASGVRKRNIIGGAEPQSEELVGESEGKTELLYHD